MAKQTVSPQIRAAIKSARRLVEEVSKSDGNEAETRRRVERIFEDVMGYDMGHLSREYAVKGTGDTEEHVDFAIKLDKGPDAKPVVMVELKRVNVDLAPKHLKQVCTYAINAGCEWVLLTNGRQWRVYHVEFGQPPVTQLVDEWDLTKDDLPVLAKKFDLISLKRLHKGSLDDLWMKTKVLSPESILGALLSVQSLRQARRVLRKRTDVLVDLEDLADGLKRLLNESAAKTLDDMQLGFPERRKPGRKAGRERTSGEEQPSEPDEAPDSPAGASEETPQHDSGSN
ncbi:MAG TPA: type I restriction enzyme HsdR N-terminal domain-containing protein [Planctomycetota bacterium]|nr:type I restriction enzyme HsdR N-terminal domain-containing protein [Planctomycetota bacterium]